MDTSGTYNVWIGFQYVITADGATDASQEARRRFIEDVEGAGAVTDGLEDLVRWAEVRTSPAVDYDQLIRQHLDGVEEK
jgi:hypothetical protein